MQGEQSFSIVQLIDIFKIYVLDTNGSVQILKYNYQGPDFDDMSSFFPCEIDDANQYINLGYGAQAPKIVIL